MLKFLNLFFLALFVTIHKSKEMHGFMLSSYPTSRFSRKSRPCTQQETKALYVNFISFDLDDTIFPIGPVVADANEALFNHLKSLGCETTEEEYIKTTKSIRNELSKDDKTITYTELRKRTIRIELEKHTEGNNVNASTVSGAYDIWEKQRHMAADANLYPGTVSMLKELKTCYPNAIIAAITNGKGNPLKMDSIREYFDFCVSGEDDDVFPLRKPHRGIYEVALERFQALSSERTGEPIDMKEQCWIHVGDDLANDVGASAQCGAKAIWVDLEDEFSKPAMDRVSSQPQPVWSTATKEEVEKRKLLNENARQYASSRVTTLDALPSNIKNLTESFVRAT